MLSFGQSLKLAKTGGGVLGICIIAYIFLEWRKSGDLRRIQNEKWIAKERKRWKEKLRNKKELELIRELGKICSEKYTTSKLYCKRREKLGINPEMVLNSKKDAKRRVIEEF